MISWLEIDDFFKAIMFSYIAIQGYKWRRNHNTCKGYEIKGFTRRYL